MQVQPIALNKQYAMQKAQEGVPYVMYHSSTPPPFQYQFNGQQNMFQQNYAQISLLTPQFSQATVQSAYPLYMPDSSFIQLISTKQYSESMPMFNIQQPISQRSFESLLNDPSLTFTPNQMGLIPSSTWSSEVVTFGAMVQNFFRRRNSSSSKFPYKLYNALRIVELYPEYFQHIGVRWVDDNIIWVNREPFAKLIGVKTIEGGLFHQQGNFPSHGFVELSFEESETVAAHHNLGHVDLSHMRMVRHSAGIFKRGCTEADLERCKWKGG